MAAAGRAPHIGPLLREWRGRRNVSQLQLASGAAVSARHLSFIETGRSRPSREMVLHLAERLEVPLRERNHLLLAAGFAPVYGERSLDSEEMQPVRQALERFLRAHEPYPAIVVDRHFNLVLGNAPVDLFTADVSAELLEPPVNAIRASLHPQGLAPRILNFGQWSAHLVHRLRRQVAFTGDTELEALLVEVLTYPGVRDETGPLDVTGAADIVLPLQVQQGDARLAFFSTLTTFGTAADVTLAELAVEAFYPADEETAALLGSLSSR